MKNAQELYPSEHMDFWKIEHPEYEVAIKWSQNNFEDYKNLSYNFFECGYKVFYEVIKDNSNTEKTDRWFLVGIFLVRQSIELGLKALLCRTADDKNEIQKAIETHGHNLQDFYKHYEEKNKEAYLCNEEKDWLKQYFENLQSIDPNSNMFRFPFYNDFLEKYEDKSLKIDDVANNMIQAFYLVKKCIEKGVIDEDDKFNSSLIPDFFIFAPSGMGNCYLWQSHYNDGFYIKISGYTSVSDYIFNNQEIDVSVKVYPLIFMFRNTLELCLKQLIFSNFNRKNRDHSLKKMWEIIKPEISKYTYASKDIKLIDNVENLINTIDSIDRKGYIFKYPTSKNLDYNSCLDNKTLDLKNIYCYLKSLVNYLDTYIFSIEEIKKIQMKINSEL